MLSKARDGFTADPLVVRAILWVWLKESSLGDHRFMFLFTNRVFLELDTLLMSHSHVQEDKKQNEIEDGHSNIW